MIFIFLFFFVNSFLAGDSNKNFQAKKYVQVEYSPKLPFFLGASFVGLNYLAKKSLFKNFASFSSVTYRKPAIAGFFVGLVSNGLIALINLKRCNAFKKNYNYIHSVQVNFMFPSFFIPFPDTINKILGMKTLPCWLNIDCFKDLMKKDSIILLRDDRFCSREKYGGQKKTSLFGGSDSSEKRFFLFHYSEGFDLSKIKQNIYYVDLMSMAKVDDSENVAFAVLPLEVDKNKNEYENYAYKNYISKEFNSSNINSFSVDKNKEFFNKDEKGYLLSHNFIFEIYEKKV